VGQGQERFTEYKQMLARNSSDVLSEFSSLKVAGQIQTQEKSKSLKLTSNHDLIPLALARNYSDMGIISMYQWQYDCLLVAKSTKNLSIIHA
jgi:hypothetical protein